MRFLILPSLIAAMLIAPIHASGGHCRQRVVKQQIVVAQNVVTVNGLVVTAFAIPVAVPVATVQSPQVFYSLGYGTSPGAGYGGEQGRDGGTDAPPAVPEPPAPDVPLTAASVVANKCAKCHGGEAPDAGLHLDGVDVGGLEREARRTILDRILAADEKQRMPKGDTLTADEFRVLMDALVQ